jgi:NADPH2:quinone reductase
MHHWEFRINWPKHGARLVICCKAGSELHLGEPHHLPIGLLDEDRRCHEAVPWEDMMAQKVWLIREPGGSFHESEIPYASPGRNQVLVRIHASGVNPLDTKIRAGKAAHAKQPLPAVLGVDMGGIVEEVGPGVTAFKPGDEVYGMVGGVGGHQGTLAEMIVVDVDLLAHKPKSLAMRQAAALPLSVITAWEGLVDRAKVHAGQTVLVHAGAGGIGHIAIQIAQAYGAKVFATVSQDKRKVVEDLGASPIDYRLRTVEDYVSDCTGGKGFDIVYDTVGGATLDASFLAVKRYTGHVLSCLGWGSHSLAPLSFRGASYSGVFTLLPLITGENRAHHGKILAQAATLSEQGKLLPFLGDQRFSVADLSAAYALVEAGSLGKVVVEIRS